MRCPTCDTSLYLRQCPGYMDKILYCDKCYAYWSKVRSQKEIDELRGHIAALKAALLNARNSAWSRKQLAIEMPAIFGEDAKMEAERE
jgi:hypothetical protein